jgi:F-type H+-transporting ATPase subunit a
LLGSALGLFGLRPITADVNVTFALSILTFLLIQGSEFRKFGIIGKFKHMCDPYPFMLPLKMLEEVTLPVSLGFRLFGNILGGLIVVDIWLNFMTYLSEYVTDVPFLRAITVLPLNGFFDIFEPIIQTFIFTMLTMIFLGLGININKKSN